MIEVENERTHVKQTDHIIAAGSKPPTKNLTFFFRFAGPITPNPSSKDLYLPSVNEQDNLGIDQQMLLLMFDHTVCSGSRDLQLRPSPSSAGPPCLPPHPCLSHPSSKVWKGSQMNTSCSGRQKIAAEACFKSCDPRLVST